MTRPPATVVSCMETRDGDPMLNDQHWTRLKEGASVGLDGDDRIVGAGG